MWRNRKSDFEATDDSNTSAGKVTSFAETVEKGDGHVVSGLVRAANGVALDLVHGHGEAERPHLSVADVVDAAGDGAPVDEVSREAPE